LAVEAASQAGIIVVAAAGNIGIDPDTGTPGYGGITSPGGAPSVITVGSVDTAGTVSRGDDVVGPYSSRGPTWYDALAKPDVVAPGHHLEARGNQYSTLYNLLAGQYPQLLEYTDPRVQYAPYYVLTGTSMASAVTSGVVALMVEANQQAHPNSPLTPNAAKAVLQFTAVPLTTIDPVTKQQYDILTQGAGQVNAAGAIALGGAGGPANPAAAFPGSPQWDSTIGGGPRAPGQMLYS